MWLKFHINPKSYKWLRRILVGGLDLDVFFATFLAIFLTFESHLADTMSQIQWYFFSPMCLYASFELHYSSKFFHWSRFRNQISPPNVLTKFKHHFSTLKHYNLTIYVAKWLQIWFTSSTTHTLYKIVRLRSL